MKFSLIIPTYNEAPHISAALKRLREISGEGPLEIIVVDGKSEDDTVAEARDWSDEVVCLDAPNRGAQFHAGVGKATGDLLLFMLPEVQPPGNWQKSLELFWLSGEAEKTAATVFSVDYGASRSFRVASALTNARVAWRGIACAEQGFCTTPEKYEKVGGFPEQPILEDYVFSRRLKKVGGIKLLPEHIWPAARRMRRVGAMNCLLYRRWLEMRLSLGGSPEALWKSYQGF